MAKAIYLLERELEYAKARVEWFKRTDRPVKTTRDAQPKDECAYTPLLLKFGTVSPKLKLQVSRAAIGFFGLGNLNLSQDASVMADAIPRPRGFRPTKIHAMVGDATPQVKRAYNGTGRRYIDYSANTDGSAQAHYSAPLCGSGAQTVAAIESAVAAIKTAKNSTVGEYGRIWRELERYSG